MEITRKSVLSDALQYRETIMRGFSVQGRGLEARRGYQDEFERYRKECRILRELIQALENEGVRAAIARFSEDGSGLKEWQKEAMAGEKQAGLFAKG